MYDLILKGGRIYDGSGLPSFIGDVAIRDGKIAAIGRINEAAERVLDVGGLAVAPGIIDFHTHFDAQLWWDPLASSSNEHGVTTVVMGNCGLTLAPCKPESRDALIGTFVRVEAMPRASLASGHSLGVDDPWEYLDALERKPLGLNVATLIGHCAVRQYAMGEASVEREANDERNRRDGRTRSAKAWRRAPSGFRRIPTKATIAKTASRWRADSPAWTKSPACAASSANPSAAWCNSPTAPSPRPSMSRTSANGTTRFYRKPAGR